MIQHSYQDWLQIQLFYNGLNGQNQTIVDAEDGGTLMAKIVEEAFTLLEIMASNNYQWPIERLIAKKVAWVYEVDQFIALCTQIAALSNQFASFTTQGVGPKDSAAMKNTSYPSIDADLEQAQYVNNKNFGFRGN